jgi:hypothetical protein
MRAQPAANGINSPIEGLAAFPFLVAEELSLHNAITRES